MADIEIKTYVPIETLPLSTSYCNESSMISVASKVLFRLSNVKLRFNVLSFYLFISVFSVF